MADNEGLVCDTRPSARQRYTESVHATVRALPAAFDTKAVFFAGLVAACLAWSVNHLPFRVFPLSYDVAHGWLYLYLLLSAVSLLSAYLVIFAWTGGDKGVLFSFVSLASRKNVDRVLQEVGEYSEQQLNDAALRHSYELSVLCRKKALWLNTAIGAGLPAIALMAVNQVYPLWSIVG